MSEISKLKQIGLFAHVDGRILEGLAPLLSEETFAGGQVIFSEDDPGDDIYFVLSGEVEIVKYINKEGGLAQSLSSLGQGEFFGEMALFDKKKRSATVRAKGGAVLLKLNCEDFYNFIVTDAQVAISILGGMLTQTVKRLRETDIGYVTIYETGRILASEQDLQKILDGVLAKILEVFTTVDSGMIALWNEFSEIFEARATAGAGSGDRVLQKDDCVIKWLKENKLPLCVEDAATTDCFDKALLPGYCGRSFIVQPLIHREELLGFILLSHPSKPLNLTRSQVYLLAGIAAQMAPVVANAKKLDEAANRARLQRAKARDKIFP